MIQGARNDYLHFVYGAFGTRYLPHTRNELGFRYPCPRAAGWPGAVQASARPSFLQK